MSRSDEARLAQRAALGDSDALRTLLKRHAPAIRGHLGSRIPRRFRSVLSADDVMQQTYADAICGIRGFVWRHDGSFAAWLSTLARRNLLDAITMLAAEKRGGSFQRIAPTRPADTWSTFLNTLTGGGDSPSGVAMSHEVTAVVADALTRLPPQYRAVIERCDLANEPVTQVAAAIGRSPGAVYMLRARAHDRLREILGSESRFFTKSA